MDGASQLSWVTGAAEPPLLEITIGQALDEAARRWGMREALIVRHRQGPDIQRAHQPCRLLDRMFRMCDCNIAGHHLFDSHAFSPCPRMSRWGNRGRARSIRLEFNFIVLPDACRM